jgi:hypothetical protein
VRCSGNASVHLRPVTAVSGFGVGALDDSWLDVLEDPSPGIVLVDGVFQCELITESCYRRKSS